MVAPTFRSASPRGASRVQCCWRSVRPGDADWKVGATAPHPGLRPPLSTNGVERGLTSIAYLSKPLSACRWGTCPASGNPPERQGRPKAGVRARVASTNCAHASFSFRPGQVGVREQENRFVAGSPVHVLLMPCSLSCSRSCSWSCCCWKTVEHEHTVSAPRRSTISCWSTGAGVITLSLTARRMASAAGLPQSPLWQMSADLEGRGLGGMRG